MLLAVACSVKVPAVALCTLNVATPFTSEKAAAGEMVGPADKLLSETGTPCTGVLAVSRTVTVTVVGTPTGALTVRGAIVESVLLTCVTKSATGVVRTVLPAWICSEYDPGAFAVTWKSA
jgi:hypothetical protein